MICMVARNQMKPGKKDAVARALKKEGAPAIAELPGFKGLYLLAGAKDEYTALVLWDTRAHGDAWVTYPGRMKLLKAMAPLLEGPMKIEWQEVLLAP